MTLSEITTAMKAYSAQRNQAGTATMTAWFGQGNMFSYSPQQSSSSNPDIHIYPAIDSTNKLVMLVINAEKDVSTNSSIANDVQVCSVSMVMPTQQGNQGGLPSQEALARIGAWYQNYQAWITANIATTDSIFQAFSLPKADANFGNQHNAFLALNPPSASPITSAKGDIVVQDVDSSAFEYYDTGMPVPPFPGGGGGFYLLTLV